MAAGVAAGLLVFTTQFPYGAYLNDAARRLFASYANDLLQPFGLYAALCALDVFAPGLRPWQRKAGLAFLLPLALELMQLAWQPGWELDPATAYHWGLGLAFDPLDILAYALGVLSAALLDQRLLPQAE